jgi:hypothetical protein
MFSFGEGSNSTTNERARIGHFSAIFFTAQRLFGCTPVRRHGLLVSNERLWHHEQSCRGEWDLAVELRLNMRRKKGVRFCAIARTAGGRKP